MELTEKISGAGTYRALAKVLYDHFHLTMQIESMAVSDSLGLWHIFPGDQIKTHPGSFFRLRKKDRVAFLRNHKKNKKTIAEFHSLWMSLIGLRLRSTDLAERLKRLELLRASEGQLSRRELLRFKEKTRREFEAKIHLFGRYSHDLKTPFSMLISNLEGMILNDAAIPVSVKLRLETIRRTIYNILRNASQSLDAARLLTRKKRTILIPYNFSDFTKQVVEVYAIVFESYGIRLETEIEPDIPAEIDPIQMEKILNNLLNNAIKHNIPGGIAHVSLKTNGNKIEFSIADTGLGALPQHEAETASKVGEMNPWIFSSHGYGLEIVRELVRSNRGKMRFVARQGIGTTVTITLPAAPGLKAVVKALRAHNFQFTIHEVEFLANERTQLSRRKKHYATGSLT